MSAFCSTSGPMFIVGAVGIGMFESTKFGYILFLSHAISALINGLIFRNFHTEKSEKKKLFNLKKRKKIGQKTQKNLKKVEKIENCSQNPKFSEDIQKSNIKSLSTYSAPNIKSANLVTPAKFSDNFSRGSLESTKNSSTFSQSSSEYQQDSSAFSQSGQVESRKFIKHKESFGDIVLSSTDAILSVGTIITIFFLVIECLSPIFSLFPPPISALFEGMIEITRGCLSLCHLTNRQLAVTLASFVISFGGISTLLQAQTMLKSVGLETKIFALMKILHGLLSALITLILLQII